jgi:type I site-specific restriction-modification system R (restriction) subunit
MLSLAARVIREAAMQNPTLGVLADRNDLDDLLFGQFQRCANVLGQTPVQASGRELLNLASGGVVFTTIHKFGGRSETHCARGLRLPTLPFTSSRSQGTWEGEGGRLWDDETGRL